MNEKGLDEDGKKSDEDEIEHTLGPKVRKTIPMNYPSIAAFIPPSASYTCL